jgi:hypothetical protein
MNGIHEHDGVLSNVGELLYTLSVFTNNLGVNNLHFILGNCFCGGR